MPIPYNLLHRGITVERPCVYCARSCPLALTPDRGGGPACFRSEATAYVGSTAWYKAERGESGQLAGLGGPARSVGKIMEGMEFKEYSKKRQEVNPN